MSENEIRVPELAEMTITWTGPECAVSFAGVEVSTRVVGMAGTNRYGTVTAAELVDSTRPAGSGDQFHRESVGATFDRRYSLPRLRARVEDRLAGLLQHYFRERALDAAATELETDATPEAVRDATGGMLAFDTVAGVLSVKERGATVSHVLRAEITFENSDLTADVDDRSNHAAHLRGHTRRVVVSFKHPHYWGKVAEVTARYTPGEPEPVVDVSYASGGFNAGVDLADATRVKAEALSRAADVAEGLAMPPLDAGDFENW